MFLFNLLLLTQERPADGLVTYCSFDLPSLFAPILNGDVTYCSFDAALLIADPVTGSVTYCSQDMSVGPRIGITATEP